MNTQEQNYEPGIDQNQGVVGTMARHNENDPNDTELVSTRVPRMDPNIVTNQSGAAMEDGDDEAIDEDLSDEEADDDVEEDSSRDDNYALGGKVARSSGL